MVTQFSSRTVIFIGLLTGTLDALSAILLNPKIPSGHIFRFIASGVFGERAFSAGNEMIVYGLLLHYLISFIFCIVLLWAYPFFISLFKFKVILVFVFGLLIWSVMNLFILPLRGMSPATFHLISVIKNMMALIIAFGLPIVCIASNIYDRNDGGEKAKV